MICIFAVFSFFIITITGGKVNPMNNPQKKHMQTGGRRNNIPSYQNQISAEKDCNDQRHVILPAFKREDFS